MKSKIETFYSKPGLPRQAALDGLQKADFWTPGSILQDFRREPVKNPKTGKATTGRNGKPLFRWAADVKLAEFPPPSNDESKDEDPGSESDSGSDDSSDSSPKDDSGSDKGGDSKPKSESKDLSGDDAVIALLTQILEALGGSPGAPDLGPDLGPVGGPPGDLGKPKPPHGHPAGPDAGGPPVPKPKGTPPGGDDLLPTFASTLPEQFKAVHGRLQTVVVSQEDDGKSIKQAASEINEAGAEYGFKVKTVKRENGKIRALASVR